MKESPFGFEYSWEDLRPVHPLFITVLVAQVLGAISSLLMWKYASWFDNIWAGAAFATLPGFLFGMYIQSRVRPGSLSEHRVMVRRMGLVAFLLTAVAFVFPFGTA